MTPDLPQVEVAIVEMTNLFRRKENKRELRRSPVLDAVARAFADYLARTGKFSHTGDGRQPADRAKAGGYRYCQIAENLALNRDSRGFATRQLARAAVTGWKGSPGHRRNMLLDHVTDIGVGAAKAPGKNQYISVQLFGRPIELHYQFKVRNLSRKTTVRYAWEQETHQIPPHSEITHTVCRPGKLVFPPQPASSPTARAVVGASFTTSPRDLFRLRISAKGRIVIDLQPSTN